VLLSFFLSVSLFSPGPFPQFLLNRLHIERGIYHSPCTSSAASSHKAQFTTLYKIRELWLTPPPEPESSEDPDSYIPVWRLPPKPAAKFNINVCARLKPRDPNEPEPAASTSKAVTLPLHQRIQLIRMSKKLKNNAAALRVMKEEGAWFKTRWEEEESGENKENTVNASAAVQPELRGGVHDVDAFNARVTMIDPTKGLREFAFNSVFTPTVTQQSVYKDTCQPLIAEFINGFNACCLVYGQTGSGKTHTMFGPHEKGVVEHNRTRREQGIVPRACEEVFSAIEFRRENVKLDLDMRVTVSYVEIYGETVSDLLSLGARCGQSKVSAQRYVLSGAAEHEVSNMDDVRKVLEIGEKEKRRAATAMNERSSRAHALFVIGLEQRNSSNGVSCKSKLFLADLGGSEQVKKSGVAGGVSNHIQKLKNETMGVYSGGLAKTLNVDAKNAENIEEEKAPNSSDFSTGFKQSDRLREAVYINLGLLALKKCVSALNDTESSATPYIPYQDSKLTMLLSSGLGGDSKTSVIVCAAQERNHASETTSAMLFGQACRKIEKSARSGVNMLADMISKIDKEIATLEMSIKQKERWEVVEQSHKDTRAEEGTMESMGFGGVEIKKVTKLVGAEDERMRLMEMLKERAQLTGTTLESEIGGAKYGGNVGFGNADEYGMGGKVSASAAEDVYRFADDVDVTLVPDVLKKKGKIKGWGKGETDEKKLEVMAKKANRAKSAYSGISA
jgi:kinesin family protein 5